LVVVGATLSLAGRAAIVLTLIVVIACDPGRQPASAAASASNVPETASFDVGEIKSASEYLQESRFAGADLARGESLGLACAACHTLREGEKHNIGPNLHGVFGRKAGTAPGFDYSDALVQSGLVWTPRALEAWLAEPASFVPGTTMAFAGYRSETDRRDLLAYLLVVTD
jgi:cytochrome c